MASIKLIEERPVSLPELKERLEEIQTRDGNLTFRGNKVRDYLNKLTKMDSKTSKELKTKIESEFTENFSVNSNLLSERSSDFIISKIFNKVVNFPFNLV